MVWHCVVTHPGDTSSGMCNSEQKEQRQLPADVITAQALVQERDKLENGSKTKKDISIILGINDYLDSTNCLVNGEEKSR